MRDIEGTIAEAQEFFPALDYDPTGNPAVDQLLIKARVDEMNKMLFRLAELGTFQDGVFRAGFEASLEGEETLRSNLRCSPYGFCTENPRMYLGWTVEEFVDDRPNGGTFGDMENRLGILQDEGRRYNYLEDPFTGFRVVKARLATYFSPQRTVTLVDSLAGGTPDSE